MKKHILIYSQYFYPEQFRINDIAKELVKMGYRVSVVTGIPNYPQGKFYDGYDWNNKRFENWEGIDIYRIPITPRGKKSIGLAFNYLSFVAFARLLERKLPKDVDIVFTYEVSPMTQALPAVWYAKKHGLRHLLYVMDLWPESILAVTNIKNKYIIEPIDRMVNYIYHQSDKILTSSKSFIPSVAKYGIEKEKIMFWPQYAEDIYAVKDSANEMVQAETFSELSIVFAGNMGEAQGLDILPRAAQKLKEEFIHANFVLIGDGRTKDALLEQIKDLAVENYFYFIDRQPAEKIPYYLAKYDVALIPLAKSEIFSKTIPAKVQSLMACGKPLLVSADGEVQRIVEEADCGLSSQAEDLDTFVANVKSMIAMDATRIKEMGKNARQYYETHFDKAMLMQQLVNLIEER